MAASSSLSGMRRMGRFSCSATSSAASSCLSPRVPMPDCLHQEVKPGKVDGIPVVWSCKNSERKGLRRWAPWQCSVTRGSAGLSFTGQQRDPQLEVPNFVWLFVMLVTI